MFLRYNFHKLFRTIMQKQKKISTVRRDKLISLEPRARAIWERYQYFISEPNQKPKYFSTFPFPYMNGSLHIGHAFSMSKVDFNAWYKRLCGYNVLFPFGYHCTGMPISAAAKKLKYELDTYGNPPELPKHKSQDDPKFQYEIMQQLDIKQTEIPKFIEAHYWVKYFPPMAKDHISRFGTHVDHSRSFITTQLNPYYDSFIRWQFTLLKQRGYIKYGKRPSVFSPKDNQMCADHDRAEGEGVTPEEYTLVKILVVQLNQRMKKSLEGRNVFLVAATLRPETMYGQTSCYLLPSGDYIAIEMKNDEVFICSQRSALNMAFQDLTRHPQQIQTIDTFKGQQLMGLPLKAPNAIHQRIYTIPMMTISMKKATGVVACVPSDSPDDWMATCDLRNKKAFRDKYNITQQMVNLPPIQIINIPTYGNLSAVTICEQMNIKSQNDKQLLQQAKQQVYKKGFHEGTMVIGNFKGLKVAQAKLLVKRQLIDSNQALIYWQPNGKVISRSGDQCVVSYCDQWYLNYANQQWKKRVLNHVEKNFKCNSEVLHKELVYTISWLREWGCSRSFGLGTKLPFDQKYLIQSLSDSTIYFAYYTVAHFLQGDIEGSTPGFLGIRPEELTLDFWSHIFLGHEYKSSKIPPYKLQKCRQSFLYWYPLDLRCSAKDLIKNHLTMALFNHAAIWDDEKFWPKAYYCNGYINVEGEKMSKSKGNFITLIQAVQDYGADAARMACATAGDSINDANFTKQNANAAIMQLSTLQMFLAKALQHKHIYRKPQTETTKSIKHFDTIFQSQIEQQINKVHQAYQKMIYRDVIKYGLHDFTGIKDLYVLNCGNYKPKADLIERYVYLQLVFLYPICPHFCQVAYIDYFLTFAKNYKEYAPLMGSCEFPKPNIDINYSAIRSHQYYIKFMIQARESLAKSKKPRKGQQPPKFTKAVIIYRQHFQEYQIEMLKILKSCIVDGEIRADWRSQVKIENKEEKTKCLKFGGFIEKQYKIVGKDILDQHLPFIERQVLQSFSANIKQQFNYDIQFVEVAKAPERDNKGWKDTLNGITPGSPIIVFE